MVGAETRPSKTAEWEGIAEEETMNVGNYFEKLGNKRRRNMGWRELKGIRQRERFVLDSICVCPCADESNPIEQKLVVGEVEGMNAGRTFEERNENETQAI